MNALGRWPATWLGDTPIRWKLTLGFVVVLALAALGSAVGLATVDSIGRLAVELYDKPLQAIDFARVAQSDLREMVTAQRMLAHPEPDTVERAKESYTRSRALLEEDLDVAQRRAASAGMRAQLDRVAALLAQWDAARAAGAGSLHPLGDEMQDTLDIAVETAKADGFLFVEDVRRQTAAGLWLTLAAGLAVLFTGAAVALVLSRDIVRPLKAAVTTAETIAGGHLDDPLVSGRRDEAGKLLRAMEAMRIQLRARVEADRRLVELERERRVNLGRYLPAQIAGQLAEHGTAILSAGRRQEVAVLFTDVRGFTTLAESLDPASLWQFLTEFRRRVAVAADAHGGVIDKFIGDAAMVVFGVPEPRQDAARDALGCARALLREVADWNGDREEPVRIGIGVHWGPVFCGAVGDGGRLEYTVVGDTVNVAARLQDETKAAGVPLVASHTALAAAGEEPEAGGWRALPAKPLRGRDGVVALYGWSLEGAVTRS